MAINVVLKSVFDDRGIKEAERAFDQLGRGVDQAFKALTVAAGAAAIGLVKFGGDAIKAASDLEESTNAVNVSFLEASEAVLKIGETSAEALGLARTEFNQAAVRFSAFSDRVVGEGGDVAGFIGDITTRAADFASVFNIEVAEALQVFQSGLAGEAEPLKRFGINLLESEVKAYALRAGIISVGESMDETQKVQARFGLLMESTAKTAGDFANTSDGLANSQRILRARFTDLQAEIGNALLPVVTELFQAFAEKLLPKLEELGEFLASPEGQQIIEDVAESFLNFFDTIVNNIDEIIDFTIKVAAAVAGLKILKTTIELATVAQRLFNLAVKANPYVIAAIALGTLVAAAIAFNDETDKTIANYKTLQSRTDQVNYQQKNLADTYRESAWAADKYGVQTDDLRDANLKLAGAADMVSGEMGRFNRIKMDALRAEIYATKDATEDLNEASRQYGLARMGLLTGTPTGRGAEVANALLGGGPSGPTAFERVQGFIKDAQKDLLKAQQTLNNNLEDARNSYAQGVLRTERQFADKLADIVQRSQNRLRTAFADVVRVSLTDIFTVEETQSVENLVKGLQERLSKSRALLERAGALNAAGFSQTFIEQVVQAGVDTGNELAQAILDATPDTQRELQGLFSEVERTAETGMDSLAREIYDRAGLATTELKTLYADTQSELTQALIDLQAELDQSIINANERFVDSITSIRERLAEQIEGMKGDLGGLEKTYEQFVNKLNRLEQQFEAKIEAPIQAPPIQTPIGPIAAPVITPLPQPATVTPRQTAPVINVNVKTDTTQSPAMVGQSIAKTISKYTGGGGGLKGISVVAL